MSITDNDLDETTPAAQSATLVEEIYATPDPVLKAFVASAEQYGLQMPVTLHVSGVVISGHLISASRYFELAAEALAQAGDKDFADALMLPTAELLRSAPDEPVSSAAVNFIHLRDAQVFTSGSDRPLPKATWRGRLAHVSGWSLGAMEAS